MGKPTELSASRSLLLCVVAEFQRAAHVHEIRSRCQAALGDSPFHVQYLKQALFELEDKGWLQSSARGFYAVSEKGMEYVKKFTTAITALGRESQNPPPQQRETLQNRNNPQIDLRGNDSPIDDTQFDLDSNPAADLLDQIMPLWNWARIPTLKASLKRKVSQWLEEPDADLVEEAAADWFIVQLGGEATLSPAKRKKYDEALDATETILKACLKVNTEEG